MTNRDAPAEGVDPILPPPSPNPPPPGPLPPPVPQPPPPPRPRPGEPIPHRPGKAPVTGVAPATPLSGVK